MKKKPTTKSPARKLGANRNEVARKQPKKKPGFSQSRDIHEDRGSRQIKFGHGEHTIQRGRSIK